MEDNFQGFTLSSSFLHSSLHLPLPPSLSSFLSSPLSLFQMEHTDAEDHRHQYSHGRPHAGDGVRVPCPSREPDRVKSAESRVRSGPDGPVSGRDRVLAGTVPRPLPTGQHHCQVDVGGRKERGCSCVQKAHSHS